MAAFAFEELKMHRGKLSMYKKLLLYVLLPIGVAASFFLGYKYATDEIYNCAYSPLLYKEMYQQSVGKTYIQILAECTGKSLTRK